MNGKINISSNDLAALCHKWKVQELALFGSVLRDDYSAGSDIDILVTFEPDAPWSLWDLIDMKEDFEHAFGRPVDLVEQDGLRNPWRRKEILRTREVVYAA